MAVMFRFNGAEVRRLREALGVKREVVAAAVGVSVVTIWRWEAGRAAPKEMATLGRLAAFFGLHPGEFIDEVELPQEEGVFAG